MSTVPLATVVLPMLADVVDESLAAALADHTTPCLWCGSPAVTVTNADFWSGRVVIRCRECGSELTGTVPRHLRGVPS
jgi:transcription elongation factor Elf1